MIAIISDIHGNLAALEAVIAEIDKIGCERIISLGDVAGYYCDVDACISILRERSCQNIMGNHDYYLAWDVPCPRSRTANILLAHQRARILPENLQWLRHSLRKIEGAGVSYVHGGWRDPLDEYLFDVNVSYFAGESATHFFSGHTHIQVLNQLGRICHCNPGSVGQPRDHDPRAAFAVLDEKDVELRRVAYDIDRTAAAMRASGFDRYYYEGLYKGQRIGG